MNSESQAIAVENLNVKDMMKNHHLAGAIGDAAMSELLRQLKYKCDWYGRAFVQVDRFYPSSKTCSCCGSVNHSLTLGQQEWVCPECGATHDRDLNAAVNIATKGKKLLKGTVGHTGTAGHEPVNACGADVRPECLDGSLANRVETRIPYL